MHRVVSVKPLSNNRINISFSDGTVGVVDVSDIVGRGVFAALSDPAEFAKVYVNPESRTVTWPGELDLCPDSLYEDIVSQQKAA
jgi:hypothetical protein